MKTALEDIYRKETSSPFKDSLTGLFNYGFFLEYLEQELMRFKRSGNIFSLVMLDIDEFSLFNQKYGPIRGDQTLRTVGRTVSRNIRGIDIGARYAGDKYIIILVGSGPEEAIVATERIRASIGEKMAGKVTVSIGITSLKPGSSPDAECIINEANSALLQAKIRGKNKVCVFHPEEKQGFEDRAEILIVDDDNLNLKYLEGILTPLGYGIHKAASGPESLYMLASREIDLVLLDIMMPVMDGFEVCNTIKTNEETRMIPVILFTSLDDVETKIRGIESGADDFITKPPNKPELLARIKSLLKLKKLNNNLTSIENVLFSMAKTVESKDRYTQGHVDRVSEIAISIGKEMKLSRSELEALRFGGALHDIGKLGIPGKILNKPGPLDDEEWAIMREHPEIGYRICLPLKKNLGQALDVVRHHHEKLDGSGYPDGLKNEDISLVARIMAVADIYDALITDRPYREAMSNNKALEILNREACEGKLDRNVVECLSNLVEKKIVRYLSFDASFSDDISNVA